MSPPRPVFLKIAGKLFTPIMALAAFYVLLAGGAVPGGGLAAGLILALAIMLYGLVFGLDAAREALPLRALQAAASAGLLFYLALGAIGLLQGQAFLDYQALSKNPGLHGQRLGVAAAQFSLALAVAGACGVIFYCFVGRAPALELNFAVSDDDPPTSGRDA